MPDAAAKLKEGSGWCTHSRRSVPHAHVLLVGWTGAGGPVERVGGLGDVEAVVLGVCVPGRRRARVQVGAPGRRVGPLRGQLRHPDGAGRARDGAARAVLPVPRRPELPGALHRGRQPGGRRRLHAGSRHAVLQRGVVVAAALRVVPHLPPLQTEPTQNLVFRFRHGRGQDRVEYADGK